MLNILSREIERRGSNTIVFPCVDYYAKRLAETISFVENNGKRYLSCEFYCGEITLQDLYIVIEKGERLPLQNTKNFIRNIKYDKYDFSHPEEHFVEVELSKKRYNDYCKEHAQEINERANAFQRTIPYFWRKYEYPYITLKNRGHK